MEDTVSEERKKILFEQGADARRSGMPRDENPFRRFEQEARAVEWERGWDWSDKNEDHTPAPEDLDPFAALYGLRHKRTGRLLSFGVRAYEDPELRCPAKELSAYDSPHGQFILVTADRSMLELMIAGKQPYCGAIFDRVGMHRVIPSEVEIVALTVADAVSPQARR